MLVYSSILHPRLDYIIRWMFSFSGEELRITTDSGVFEEYSGPKVWYSNEACPAGDGHAAEQICQSILQYI